MFNLDAHDLVSHTYGLYPDLLNLRLNCLVTPEYLSFLFSWNTSVHCRANPLLVL